MNKEVVQNLTIRNKTAKKKQRHDKDRLSCIRYSDKLKKKMDKIRITKVYIVPNIALIRQQIV
jgi:hypothetical protein